MAFNPFESFRKNQRSLMAFAAIVCMIVFVFSFGQGDFFQTLQEWLATRTRPGTQVTTLYGEPVFEAQLDKIARQRDLANTFMVRTTALGVNMAMTELEKQQKDIKEGMENTFGRVMQGWGMRRNPFFEQQMRLPPGWQAMSVQNDLSFLSAQSSVIKNPDQMRVLETLSISLGFEAWETNTAMRGLEEMFFGGGKTSEDLLDFMVWLKVADKLNIKLAQDDIRMAVNREAANQEVWPAPLPLKQIPSVQGLAKNGALNEDELLAGLTNEFRVIMAKESILGESPGVRAYRDLREPMQRLGNAGTPSPSEFFTFFKDYRASLGVIMLPIQAEDFISKVTEEPTPEEIKSFFNSFKNDEENPGSDRPGFRQPRIVKGEYATAKADSPVFRKKAQANALAPFVTRTLAFLQADSFGGSIGAAIGNILPGFSQEPMYAEYRIFKDSRSSWFDPPFASSEVLHEQSTQQPALIAGLVGQIAGTQQTLGSPFLTAAIYPGGALAYEASARLKILTSTILACASTNPYSAIALPFNFVPPAPEMETVITTLFDKYLDILSPRMMRENFILFTEELAKLKNKPEDANKLVAKGISEYGLEIRSMKSSKPYFEMASVPEFSDLKKSFIESYRDAPQAPEFWQLFFQGNGTYETTRWSPDERMFQNDPSRWIFSKEPYLIWRSEDLAPRDRTLAEVTPEIIKAWKLQKARRLARAEAEKISEEAKKKTWPTSYNDLVRESKGYLAALAPSKKDSDLKELSGVTRILPQNTTGPGQSKVYQAFRIPTDIIPYPRNNLVEQLLSLKKPGETMVFRDRPENTFYVALLLSRAEPGPQEFKKIYENASSRSKEPDTLWQIFLDQYSKDFRIETMKKLRSEASGKLDDNGRIPIADSYRNRNIKDDSGS